MASLIPRRAPYVCKACRSTRSSKALLRTFVTTVERPASLRQQLEGRNSSIANENAAKNVKPFMQRRGPKVSPTSPNPAQSLPDGLPKSTVVSSIIRDPRNALREIQNNALDLLGSDRIPDDAAVQEVFAQAQTLASTLIQTQPIDSQQQHASPPSESQTSLLSDLAESSQRNTSASTLTLSDRKSIALDLAKVLYTLCEDPKLYLSESLLASYVTTITNLSLPQYLPKIFHLYARKPIPRPSSYPIKYSQPWSRAPKYAIPLRLVDMAMQSAIATKDMPLCISIIDTTVATPAYHSAKFLRKAALPLLGASSVIPLSYAAANSAAAMQLSWDPDTFFWMCMSGATAYLGTMGTLLFITMTTWNDHHKRVRWVPGTPFTKRWFGEEERAWFDKVAQEWGYKDEERWGEETGEEWEALKEVLGIRYLEVDRSSLLPGML
ncbi:hypothetical protein H2198_009675 [Neophaeococcomyces mojaviensis]|uniref:Uncharacterized protein n=1 Tax=Neophaeococcomyces mojaviensis TaxID=3383035 RepID=A0ACC2ZTT2_9EURO|nr:hypothetical protein H2198_009675 [Knufia sp. JES_112]